MKERNERGMDHARRNASCAKAPDDSSRTILTKNNGILEYEWLRADTSAVHPEECMRGDNLNERDSKRCAMQRKRVAGRKRGTDESGKKKCVITCLRYLVSPGKYEWL